MNELLKNAVRKYGFDKFKLTTLTEVSNQLELDIAEVYWIQYFQATSRQFGYNLRPGGRSDSGMATKRAREKLSLTTKGRHKTPEWRQKISASLLGKSTSWQGGHHSIETRKKQSDAAKKRPSRKGWKMSAEGRLKISLAKKRRSHKPHSEATKAKIRASHLARIKK